LVVWTFKTGTSRRRNLHPLKEKIEHFITEIFFTFVGHFGNHGSGSVFPMRILIQPTKMNADLPLDTGMFGAHFTFSFTFFKGAKEEKLEM
jgi:hypothetical protein